MATSTRVGIPGITSSSAGTHAVIGNPIHPEAARIIHSLGGDPQHFAARQVNARIASNADLVLTMTRAHRHAVLELAPRQLRRTFTLREAAELAARCGAQSLDDLAALRSHLPANDFLDIPDPIGRGADVFDIVGTQITELLPPILQLCQGLSSS